MERQDLPSRPHDRRAVHFRLAVYALTIAALALRTLGLDGFPEVLPDEGLWTSSTKNYVRFHDWFLDGRTHFLLSPVFHLLTLPLYYLTEPSIATARLVSGLAGAVSVPLLYAVTRSILKRADVALVAAALLAMSQWSINLSRQAMIESLQVALLLAVTLAASRGTLWAKAVCSVALAVLFLTKINTLWFLVPLGLLFLPGFRVAANRFGPAMHGIVVCGLGLAAAAAGYLYLYLRFPARFVTAYLYELDGVHFEPHSDPLFRFGRFGLDPSEVASTIFLLFQEAPFVFVLACVGFVILAHRRWAGSWFFVTWASVGVSFFLFQMYQPPRYFFLTFPALCVLAAVAIVSINGDRMGDATRIRRWIVAVVCSFNLLYVAALVSKNPAIKLATIRTWAAQHGKPDDRVMAASYFCTDLPMMAFPHYAFAESREALLDAIERYRIDYVIYDDLEWSSAWKGVLDQEYEPVEELSFGRVYRTRPSTGR